MTRPRRYLLRMALFVAAVIALTAALSQALLAIFSINPWLNGMILGVLVVGVLYMFRAVARLEREVRWIESFKRDQAGGFAVEADVGAPWLLAPMASMLGERKGRLVLSGTSLRTILDGIATRLEESRETSRYLIGLLVFLGLLGTFWGLLQTVSAVGKVIAGLSVNEADFSAVFQELKSGLEAPLAGMGTAFGSSLFGLAGSLVLGFLELQVGQAQNRFYNDLEEWLSGLTRLSGGGPASDEASVPAYIQALLEHTADALDNLQRVVATAEEGRAQAGQQMLALNEHLTKFTEQMKVERQVLLRVAENQLELRPVLSKLVDAVGGGKLGLDEASRMHLRNIEIHAARLAEESAAGRAQLMQELRNEIRLLARTIAAASEEQR